MISDMSIKEFKLTIDLIETSWDNLNKHQFDQIAVDIAHRIARILYGITRTMGMVCIWNTFINTA